MMEYVVVAISLWTLVLSVGWILVDVFCRGVVWMVNLTTMKEEDAQAL